MKGLIKFMTVIVTMQIIGTVLLFFVTSTLSMMDVMEAKGAKVIDKMDDMSYEIESGNYSGMVDSMEADRAYEPEFEYLWERCLMNAAARYYKIYQKAADKGAGSEFDALAEEYRQMVVDYCENPVYPENEPYGDYFMGVLE
ncbi:MAG: hypothetical protein IKY23_09650 [Lachnospiraceae bacterium]|nr:hypothetical protein [Lachnospiraceae bacterium]